MPGHGRRREGCETTGEPGMDHRRVRADRKASDVRGRGRLRATVVLALVAAGATASSCRGGADIEEPTPLFTESPVEYPLELWDRDIEGTTLVRVLVNEEGGVDSAMVMESSGHPELDSAAVRGALAMGFDPATREGEPLRVWARVPVHFSKETQPAGAGGTGDGDEEAARPMPATNPNLTSGLRR